MMIHHGSMKVSSFLTKLGTLVLSVCLLSFSASAAKKNSDEFLIKVHPESSKSESFQQNLKNSGLNSELISEDWLLVTGSESQLRSLQNKSGNVIEYVQPNYPLALMNDFRVEDPLRRAALARFAAKFPGAEIWGGRGFPSADNPSIQNLPQQRSGEDPLLPRQWGMEDIGVREAWGVSRGAPQMVVAVIDTGVDYNHEDLSANMWKNPGETGVDPQGKDKSTNGIDDDHNGFIDDVVGWDFASNDRFPYDKTTPVLRTLLGGGNPGHGTHCAGNVAARGSNSTGIAGVAPQVKIMALRFLNDKGQGNTAVALKAIRYAVDNGAKILSNSWGSAGENPREAADNRALREIIAYAQSKGVLFIAAAGNGRRGRGYDNDSDPRPSYPASYDYDNIISVAAVDSNDRLGAFSNYGAKSVDLAAPGVKVFSTMVGNRYSDQVFGAFGVGVPWDGTSMATPHVAGAAALYWSAHPEKNWMDVKAALLTSAKKISSLNGKTVSGGKLDVRALLKL